MLGPSGMEGLVIATGHHRNGILLTPVTAEAISTYILTGNLTEAARPFTPERFNKMLENPALFRMGDLYNMAQAIGVDDKLIVDLVHNEYVKRRRKRN